MRSFLEDPIEQENNILLVDVPTQSEPRDSHVNIIMYSRPIVVKASSYSRLMINTEDFQSFPFVKIPYTDVSGSPAFFLASYRY